MAMAGFRTISGLRANKGGLAGIFRRLTNRHAVLAGEVPKGPRLVIDLRLLSGSPPHGY